MSSTDFGDAAGRGDDGPAEATPRGPARAALDDAIRALRRVTLQGTVFGQSVAIRLGLSDSDVEALEALLDTGAATAGRLGEVLGLSTGAVTRLVDRLEQAGYVRRVADPTDRRRVVVEVVPERADAVRSMMSRITTASAEEIAGFTDAQLNVVADFLTRMADVTREEAERLREARPSTEEEPSRGQHAAPVGDLTDARLLFRTGAASVTLRSGPRLTELYQARFEGAVPRVTVRDGTVSISYRGFGWGKRSADLALTPRVGWRVEVQGGAANMAARLEEIDLRGFEVVGGASKLDLSLGAPRGLVPIRVVGGASALRIVRPAGAAARVRISGGVGRIDVDGSRLMPRGGETTLDSPGAATASDRYDVEILGGAAKVTIDRRDRA
ncbi:MAG TPA: MarR family transcriptional regulator [Candidatus Limnocylindrales bacterium]|nr:MarR family transcriptional regulator [Candidatus Limnocylindrales bacterium]